MPYMLIFLGGGAGAVTRFIVSSFCMRLGGTAFPWGTLAVNLIGAFCIGMILELLAFKSTPLAWVSPLLVTGFLGGFTTFSAFSLEITQFWLRGQYMVWAGYALLSVAGTMLMVLAAMRLVRLFI